MVEVAKVNVLDVQMWQEHFMSWRPLSVKWENELRTRLMNAYYDYRETPEWLEFLCRGQVIDSACLINDVFKSQENTKGDEA